MGLVYCKKWYDNGDADDDAVKQRGNSGRMTGGLPQERSNKYERKMENN